MRADISPNYIFLYDTADAAYLVLFPLYWDGCFLNVVPQSSWQRLSPGQVLFWVQLHAAEYMTALRAAQEDRKQTPQKQRSVSLMYKGGVRRPSRWSDVQTSDVTLWFWPPGCWVWSAQQWRSMPHSQGSDLHPLVLPIWKTWHQSLNFCVQVCSMQQL